MFSDSFKDDRGISRGSAAAITDLPRMSESIFLLDQVTNATLAAGSQAGTLHGIAITSPQRLEQLKDVADHAESWHPRCQLHDVAWAVRRREAPLRKRSTRYAVCAMPSPTPCGAGELKELGRWPFPAAG